MMTETANAPFFVGVDVGGTNIKLGLVDDAGQRLAQTSIPTEEEKGPADAVDRMGAAVERLLADAVLTWSDITAIGLGTPGTMDIPKGLITEPPNLPHWRHFPIRDELSHRCARRPVAFANDASAAAYGEFWMGSGRDANSMVMLTLGTGVGGGIIIDGRLLEGVNSFGAECGHLIIDCSDDARMCVWGGGKGQLEAYASASAVVARTQEMLDAGRGDRIARLIADGHPLTPKLLAEQAEAGDPFSEQVILDTAMFLAIGVINLVHLIDPGMVVLGGAMNFGGDATRIGRAFIDCVRQEFVSRSFVEVTENTSIQYATLAGDAGFIGAAGLARYQTSAGR